MSNRRRPVRSEIFEGETLWTRALIVRESDGGVARISDFEAFSVFLYDVGTVPGLVYSLPDQPPSDGFFDTPQTAGWDGNEPYYNFAAAIRPQDYAMIGRHTYEMEIKIRTLSDGTIAMTHICEVQGLWST